MADNKKVSIDKLVNRIMLNVHDDELKKILDWAEGKEEPKSEPVSEPENKSDFKPHFGREANDAVKYIAKNVSGMTEKKAKEKIYGIIKDFGTNDISAGQLIHAALKECAIEALYRSRSRIPLSEAKDGFDDKALRKIFHQISQEAFKTKAVKNAAQRKLQTATRRSSQQQSYSNDTRTDNFNVQQASIPGKKPENDLGANLRATITGTNSLTMDNLRSKLKAADDLDSFIDSSSPELVHKLAVYAARQIRKS